MNTNPPMEPVLHAVRRIEGTAEIDELSARLSPVAEQLASGPRGELLRGDWLGHALHPLMTDLPLGCWMSANLLDLVGGKSARPAARRLIGLGLLAVAPTAAAGLADWRVIEDERVRRVGTVHAVGNVLVAGCYFVSWRARGKGHLARGKLAALVGGMLALATGYLGGHLSFARRAGVGARGVGPLPASAGDDGEMGSPRADGDRSGQWAAR